MSPSEFRPNERMTTGSADLSVGDLGRSVLRSVSRSFYLSIRILPSRLRQPVALGYLLARTTDTVADTTQTPSAVRIKTLEKLADAIDAEAAPPAIVDLVASFAPLQQNRAERTLVEALPQSLHWLEELNSADRADIRDVLAKISRGQMLDLQRFGNTSEIRALATAADLDEYTYLVAGCVGEFWTRLCFRHVDNLSAVGQGEMLALGKRYGMGLQLINVLRDAGSDLRAGRCYFPEEELSAAHMTPADILHQPERFQPIYRNWMRKAENGLAAGIQYSHAIRHRRIRTATVLPALIGKRTLERLGKAGATALQRNIKITRAEVRRLILQALFSAAHKK
jgi:farnesyl-diphosphate farnesyltransferase